MHMLSPKPDSFNQTEQRMALGYQNPLYLKQVQQKQQESAKFFRDFKSLAKEADESLAKHKSLEYEIERLLRAPVSQDIMSIMQSNYVLDTSNLQTELERDLKGKSQDTPCVSDTLDPLSQKLEDENVSLEFQVSEQKDTTKGTSANTKFTKQSILGKPPSSSKSKLYSVTPLPKSKVILKVGETTLFQSQSLQTRHFLLKNQQLWKMTK
ncbi:hypothetical protein Tco_0387194 [Tanacetum coccineum]